MPTSPSIHVRSIEGKHVRSHGRPDVVDREPDLGAHQNVVIHLGLHGVGYDLKGPCMGVPSLPNYLREDMKFGALWTVPGGWRCAMGIHGPVEWQ